MPYSFTSSPRNAVPGKSFASPKTHGPGSRMSNLGHRYYQPEMGRWYSKEPMGEWGGYNLYGFNWNDAVSLVDYLGLVPLGGNYIGPNWTAGQRNTWEGTTPEQRAANPPQGRVDAGAKTHDECYANCRAKNNGKCPSDETNLNKCLNDCDRNLIRDIAKLPDKTTSERVGGSLVAAGIGLQLGVRGARIDPSTQPPGTILRW